MGFSKISVTIPDDLYEEMKSVVLDKKIKLSHLVAEAIAEKIRKVKEDAFIEKVNRAFEDQEISREQHRMAESIADSTEINELPW
ncbi:MAG: hypothetical protein GY866_09130 [Proteobacteria bacterium]|nr:hypothetical protein [Pseudomonadota bacterium]